MAASATNDASPITLPTGGGALRGIGETFAPDLHTGTGNFTVPIALPPGRNGFQPQLSLVYSTGNGNGPFGLGWNLNVPGVSRKTAKGVPRYNEAEPATALERNYERRDVFLLSGAEDLVPVDGSYPGRVRYRPRTEGVFARIEHHLDPVGHLNHWEVRSKDGLTSTYGTPGSTGDDPGTVADPDAPTSVFAWKLTRTEDPFGNCITYSYRRDKAQAYLECVHYVDIPDQTAGDRFLVSVTFEYEATERPDGFSDFRSGFEIRTALRCRAITVRTHADVERLVRRYEFGYRNDTANGVSLLSSVTVTGYGDDGSEESLPPLEFGYTGFEPETRRFSSVAGPDLPPASLANPDFETVDLFGTGLPDVLQLNGVARYWRNLGGGTFDRPRSLGQAPAGLRLADPGVQLIDADGDARADLLVTTGSDAGYFPTRFGATWDRRSFVRYAQAPTFNLEDPEVRLVDLDGDGISDALRSGTRFECFFNDPDPRKAWRRIRRVGRQGLDDFPNVNFSDPRVKWADMSGDGLQDIVLVHERSVEYWPNLGHGSWGRRRRMGNSPQLPWGYDPRRLLLGDIDGDGLADLLYVDDRQVTLWINQSGNRWSEKMTICGTPPVTDATSLRLLDLPGNGIAGLLWSRDADGIRPHLHFLDFTGGVKPYLLNRMVNNLGAETGVEYRPSTQEYLRDQRRRETRWKTPLPFPVHVVARVEAIDRISGGKLVSEYRYHHGYWDGLEREFRGFGRVDQRDTQLFGTDFHAPGLHPGFQPAPVPAFSPPLETRTWFHQGAVEAEIGDWGDSDFGGDFWTGDCDFGGDFWTADPPRPKRLQRPADTSALLASLPPRSRHDAWRSLRGSILRTELYALDGSERERRPYTVSESIYGVCEVVEDGAQARLVCAGATAPVPDGAGGQRVFFPHPRVTRTTQWERGDDPMTTIAYTDGYDAFGRPRDQTAIALPRRTAHRRPLEGAVVGTVTVDETRMLATVTRTAYAAPDATAYPDLYLHDRVAHVVTFEFAQPSGADETDPQDLVAVRCDQGAAAQQVHKAFQGALDGWSVGDPAPAAVRLIGHTRTLYDGLPFAGREDGKLGPHGAPTRRETLMFTAAELDAAYGQRRPAYLGGPAALPPGAPAGFGADLGYHLRSATTGAHCAGWYADTHRQQTDARGLVVATQDPRGGQTRQTNIGFDYLGLLPVKVTDPAGLETTATHNYRLLQPQRVTDPNENATVYRYSPLGLLHKSWLEGRAGEGGSEAHPETRHDYALRAYEVTRDTARPNPIFTHTTRRVHHASDGVSDETIQSREYSDGFGRMVQKRVYAEGVVFGESGDDVGLLVTGSDGVRRPVPGQAGGPASGSLAADRVVASGWQVYDNKGRVVEKYEPFFADGWAYQPELEAMRGRHLTMTYDPRGQLIRTVHPDGSEQRVILGVPGGLAKPDVEKPEEFEPTPWESYTYDANDLDGLRAVPPSAPTARAAPPVHRFTPASRLLDALGRVISQTERNGPHPAQDWFLTRSSHDVRGNLLAVTDPLGRTAFRHAYDLVNRALRVESIDAGVRTSVPDALGNLAEYRDSKGSIVLHEYDRLARLIRLWARDQPAQPVTLRERIEHGDGGDPAQLPADRTSNLALNRLGKPAAHRDEAGLVSFERYDFTGTLLEKVRRVINDAALARGYVADWSAGNADADLDQTDYRTSTRYDALGRAIKVTYPCEAKQRDPNSPLPPSRAVATARYNRAGALESVRVDSREYIAHIAYNARGQRLLIAYGNEVMTRYAYGPDTFRLARLRTERFTRLAGSWTWTGQGAALQDWTYAYDPAGNIAMIEEHTPGCGVADPGGDRGSLVREFAHDPLYRLTSATGRACKTTASRPLEDIAACGSGRYGPPYRPGPPTPNQTNAPDHTERYTEIYAYDPASNLLKLTYQPEPPGPKPPHWSREFGLGSKAPAQSRDAPNNRPTELRIGSTSPHIYAFDDNGNLRQQNLERFHTWDHANRMIGCRIQHGSTPSVDARYLYAADGTRVKKLVRKNGSVVPETTVYIDGIFEFHQWREDGRTKQQNYLHVTDNQSRVAITRVGDVSRHDAGPPVQYHLGDHLGSSALVVRDDATWINREEYTPYGETSFGSYARKRYRFTGKERDKETGFSYHGSRYYAPWLARWISCDPAGMVDGPNLYTYVMNRPVSNTDPTGNATYQIEDTVPGPNQRPPEIWQAPDLEGTALPDSFELSGMPQGRVATRIDGPPARAQPELALSPPPLIDADLLSPPPLIDAQAPHARSVAQKTGRPSPPSSTEQPFSPGTDEQIQQMKKTAREEYQRGLERIDEEKWRAIKRALVIDAPEKFAEWIGWLTTACSWIPAGCGVPGKVAGVLGNAAEIVSIVATAFYEGLDAGGGKVGRKLANTGFEHGLAHYLEKKGLRKSDTEKVVTALGQLFDKVAGDKIEELSKHLFPVTEPLIK